jgi:hypothetical protein
MTFFTSAGDVKMQTTNNTITRQLPVNGLSLKASAVALVACLAIAPSIYAAATTYTYTGNLFVNVTDNDPPLGSYTTSMSLSGSFTVGAPLTEASDGDISGLVQSFSFFDGRNTITDTDPDLLTPTFLVIVDATGAVLGWNLQVATEIPEYPGVYHDVIRSMSGIGPDPEPVYDPFAGSVDEGSIQECFGDPGPAPCYFDEAYLSDNPGSWSVSVVPIPAAAWLFGSALGLLGWIRHKTA